MTTSEPLDDQLIVSRVEGSAVVHLAAQGRTLCGEVVEPGCPERVFVQSPCPPCLREAGDQGIRTVRDRTTAWINLVRLAASIRSVSVDAV